LTVADDPVVFAIPPITNTFVVCLITAHIRAFALVQVPEISALSAAIFQATVPAIAGGDTPDPLLCVANRHPAGIAGGDVVPVAPASIISRSPD
jgi:hypothetical protein